MKKIYVLSLLFLPLILFAQKEPDYSIAAISQEFLNDVNVVVRNEEEIFTIENAGRATLKVKYVCTVLNKNGDEYAEVDIHYSSLRTIKSIKGKLYNKNGELVAKLKKEDIVDVNRSNYSEVLDGRIKTASFSYNFYPYTVEFEYEIDYQGLLFYPFFMPKLNKNVSIENSLFQVIAPKDHQFQYKEFNLPNKVEIKEEKDKKIYTWNFRNQRSIQFERYSPVFEQVPLVLFSPKEFEMGKYKGKMDSWESLGFFFNQLNENRQNISEETKKQIQEITQNAKTDYEKIKAVYNYMQSKTHYISIQLGIGGWQTMPAELVDKKGYGDCKALSNYTKSLLEIAGIKSYYTLVNAGGGGQNEVFPVYQDFPYSRFNHVILCVPTPKDTIWLECTSQQQPTGFLGDFTDDRYALLMTENGGKLVRTPKYTFKDNQQSRLAELEIKESGETKVKVKTKYTGLEYDNQVAYIRASKEDQKKMLYEEMNIAKFDIVTLNLKEEKNIIPILYEDLELKIDQIGAKTGKRIFFTPNLFNKFSISLVDYKERKTDIVLPFRDFEHNDELRFNIPQNFDMEGNFETINLTSVFGTYSISITKEKNTLIYKRKLQVKSGRYLKEKYQEFLDFFKKVEKYDKIKAVLVSQ